jgi:exonuclease VII small subunit
MGYRRTSNGSNRQLQSLADAFGDFRQEMANHVGELKSGQMNLQNSFNEFKDRIEDKVDEHDTSINQAKGSIGVWKWVVSVVGLSGITDALIHLKHFLGGGK